MNAVPAQYIALNYLKEHWAAPRHVDEAATLVKPRPLLPLTRWFYSTKRA